MHILCVCGARPNFVKIAAVIDALEGRPEFRTTLVHTGQHYDEGLSESLFRDLGLSRPDVDLTVGSGSHAAQTAEIMMRFEPVLEARRPDLVLVVGDVNSTLACSLVAAKLGYPVAHVEAGLRSFDRRMPEEINRILTDAIADLLFCSEPSGVDNLRREGVGDEHVFLVGNVMIDTLLRHVERAREADVMARLCLGEREYALVTLHRPSNVDDPESLRRLAGLLRRLARRLPVVVPLHPRTRNALGAEGLLSTLEADGAIHVLEPLGYVDFLCLMSHARLVLTDSGGIQEEATVLRVPCLTLRESTERPATVASGWNRLMGTDAARALAEVDEILADRFVGGAAPELWDGRAGERIADVLTSLGASGIRDLQARRFAAAAADPEGSAAAILPLLS